MGKTNGKSKLDPQELDLEHELPASDETDEAEVSGVQATTAKSVDADELQKLRTERDTLIDRLARLQAEFENARKRAAREQQEFRDFATADAIKALLPALDSFERALQARCRRLDRDQCPHRVEGDRAEARHCFMTVGCSEWASDRSRA